MKTKKTTGATTRGWLPKQNYATNRAFNQKTGVLQVLRYSVGIIISESVLWIAFFLGLYKSAELFFVCQLIIISTFFVLSAVLWYVLNRRLAGKQLIGDWIGLRQVPSKGWFSEGTTFQAAKKNEGSSTKFQADLEWKAFKRVGLANALIVGFFSGTHSLIDPYNKSFEITLLSWSLFVLLLLVANISIYRHYKKQTSSHGGY